MFPNKLRPKIKYIKIVIYYKNIMSKEKTRDKKTLLKEKNELEEKIKDYIGMFNNICDRIGSHLVSEFPKNRDINICHDVISDVVKKKPSEPISIFLVNIYANDEYRIPILESDEKFFKNSNHEEFVGNDKDSLDAMLNFRKCWDDMNSDSHEFIKEAMKTLVDLCEIYIEAKDDLNKTKKSLV